MAERGALWLLCLLGLTFLRSAAKHVDKGKRFYARLPLLLPLLVPFAPIGGGERAGMRSAD